MGLGDPVFCTNPECSEYGLPKGNPGSYPLDEGEEFICGACQSPVTDQEPAPLAEGTADVEPDAEAVAEPEHRPPEGPA